MKKLMALGLLCLAPLLASAEGTTVLWPEFTALRDAMYNRAPDSRIAGLYQEAVLAAENAFSGPVLLTALSKCEYMMGRNCLYGKKNDRAGEFFDKGAAYAKEAADSSNLSDAWVMYAENVSQNCIVKPTSYAIFYGSKISGIARQVIKAAPETGAAYVLLYAQHVYAPPPFHNYKLGIKNFKGLLEDTSVRLQRDDEFNIVSAIGYGYFQLKDYPEAASWFTRALEIYPANEFVLDLLRRAKN
ncbi:MAG: tetratricopeptide repeat protein [Spirochaetaceae bacterium]|nr:tetratricopeptide repeat protein [Spirochaetaceae bacterium]